jgi:transcriptional regulator with XRE-family HTH domain
MNFGQNLQQLRQRAGLTQAGLAEKAGIPIRTIQSWEISHRTPRWIHLLAQLAKGLGVPMEDLVTDEEIKKPSRRKGKGK